MMKCYSYFAILGHYSGFITYPTACHFAQRQSLFRYTRMSFRATRAYDKMSAVCLQRLRVIMAGRATALDAYMIDNNHDQHYSEFIAKANYRSVVLTGQGFSSRHARIIVTQERASLWTDCRYMPAADIHLDPKVWTVYLLGHPDTPTTEEYLLKLLTPKSKVGVCPHHISYRSWKNLGKELSAAGHTLVSLDRDLTDIIKEEDGISNTPTLGKEKVFVMALEHTGKSWQDKIADTRQQIKDRYADAFVVTKLDELAWLFNIRGGDIPHNPFLFGYAIITMDTISIFMDERKLTKEARIHLGLDGKSGVCDDMKIKVYPYSNITSAVTDLENRGKRIWMSTDVVASIGNLVKENNLLMEISPIARMKVCKNPVEVQAMKDCHIRDAVAHCEFFAWLEEEVSTGKVTTVTATNKFEEYFREQDGYLDSCFPTQSYIADDGSGNLISPVSGDVINDKGLYLNASGHHYRDGTTNITRVLHYGTPSEWDKECYTRVLMGHIDCAATVFPKGTKGHALDAIARRPLWDAGLDWMVLTGHGVGHVLCVMEDHYGIFNVPLYQELPLADGMTLTIEPAYYENQGPGMKKLAIRLENLFVVRPVELKRNYRGVGYLQFEVVSFVPFSRKLCKTSLMTKQQINWLNKYHAKCVEVVAPVLKEQERTRALEWLLREARPLEQDQ